MKLGGVATVPDRLDAAAQAINSILKHGDLDALVVALNGHTRKEADRLLRSVRSKRAKVVFLPQDNTKGDGAKFSGWSPTEDYFSFDDDLYYTEAYFRALEQGREALDGAEPFVVSLHGRKMHPPYRHYYGRGATKYPCLKTVDGYHEVDFPGTGVLLIPANTLKVDKAAMVHPNMADVWIGKFAREQNVRCFVVPHREGDVMHLPIDMHKTIATSMRSPYIDQVMRETMLS